MTNDLPLHPGRAAVLGAEIAAHALDCLMRTWVSTCSAEGMDVTKEQLDAAGRAMTEKSAEVADVIADSLRRGGETVSDLFNIAGHAISGAGVAAMILGGEQPGETDGKN
jgi:hypothetical protein